MAEIGVLTSSKRKVHECLSIEYYLRALSDEDGGLFNFPCPFSTVNSSPVTGSPHLYAFQHRTICLRWLHEMSRADLAWSCAHQIVYERGRPMKSKLDL